MDTYILCVEPCGAGVHDKKEIIDWNSGLISDRKNRLHKTLTVAHDGVKYSYAGDDRGTVGGVVEYVNITGTTPYALRLHFRNNGRTRNKEYKHRGFDHADRGAAKSIEGVRPSTGGVAHALAAQGLKPRSSAGHGGGSARSVSAGRSEVAAPASLDTANRQARTPSREEKRAS